MRYLMGVDGGGSKTYTVITDEYGNKVGEGLSGRGNHQVEGIQFA
ncbi:MAG TPA: ATPase, partial [Ureibacillus sp.]|nr:ATPase [Ureibacillus sp.]